MLGTTDYATFVITILVFLLVLGPGNPALITSTSKGSFRGELAATFGVILGGQVLIWSAIAGVAALLTAYPNVFHAMHWLSAAYLARLGAKLLLAKPGAAPVLQIKQHHYLKQVMTIMLLNPRAILFYMAFFPLFVDLARQQGLVTYAFMAATIAVLTFFCGLTATLPMLFLAGKVRANPLISRILERVAGVFFVGFGIKLAASN